MGLPRLYSLLSRHFDADRHYIVNLLGSLETERINYITGYDNEIISCDKSSYLGIVDYELEWETSRIREVELELTKLFSQMNITPILNNDSKTTRFKKSLKGSSVNS